MQSRFIQKAKYIHGEDYDYSKINYINIQTKIEIICNKCKKSFFQLPSNHLQGKGCPYCNNRQKTTEKFITEAIALYKDRYDYSEVKYKNKDTKVKIFCNTCKEYFWQTPHNHLHNHGCPYCKSKKTKELFAKSTTQFIKQATILHKNKYNYDQVEYKNSHQKIKIYCNTCKNYFEQSPCNHLNGAGCPHCNKIQNSKGETFIKEWLNRHNILYEAQKKFQDCKDKRCLPFDFYLPDYNLCIEFQGKQHYDPRFFITMCKMSKTKGLFYFKMQQKRDRIKKNYCKKKKIALLEIKYCDNIKKELEKNILYSKGKVNS